MCYHIFQSHGWNFSPGLPSSIIPLWFDPSRHQPKVLQIWRRIPLKTYVLWFFCGYPLCPNFAQSASKICSSRDWNNFSLLPDSMYFVMVATATVLSVGKYSKREQPFPLFACLVWNPFSAEVLRNCSALKQLLFKLGFLLIYILVCFRNFFNKIIISRYGFGRKTLILILASDCWWPKSSGNWYQYGFIS